MLCSVNQIILSRILDDNAKLPALLERHLQQCDSCRAFYQNGLSLGQKLKNQRPRSSAAFGDTLAEDVLRRIPFYHPGQSQSPARIISWQPLLAAAAVFIVLLSCFTLVHIQQQSRNKATFQDAVQLCGSILTENVNTIWPPDQKPSGDILDSTLGRESIRLTDDVQAAMSHVLGCMPIGLVASAE